MKVLTARQMREADRATIEELGIPGLALMENAGRNVYRVIREKFPDVPSERIVILCGKGNNGGDGLVIARHLLRDATGMPSVILLAAPEDLKGDARANYERLIETGCIPVVARNMNEWHDAKTRVAACALLVDAILGTGLEGPVTGFYSHVIRDVNSSFAHVPTVAVDMPSGFPSDTGAQTGDSLAARYTVTFAAPKWSHVFPPNCERAGEVFVTRIGTPPSMIENDAAIYLNLMTSADVAWIGAKRRANSHKGTYGHVLVVGGSVGKSGAAALAGMGALRAGAGLVTVATATNAWQAVANVSPALMTEPLAETETGAISLGAFDYGRFDKICEGKSVIAIGPGLSTHSSTVAFVRRVVASSAHIPIVIDADGLNAFDGATEVLDGRGRKLILTPHPGEMARLTGRSTKEIQADRVNIAREFAMRRQVYLVLKGYRTLIAEPGGQVYVNPTGNPGMSTGGTGDVLTGMIAGLLAQHSDVAVEKVVSAAVYWHGAAGDAAAEIQGELSLIATDLLDSMPQALHKIVAQADSTNSGECIRI